MGNRDEYGKWIFMSTPRLWIKQLTFSDGTTVRLKKSDIVLIVGPNNAGKSAALRAIRDRITTAPNQSPSPVLSSLELDREGTVSDVEEWLKSFARVVNEPTIDPSYQALGGA